jgi:K+-sensing histidine kinase KdpD
LLLDLVVLDSERLHLQSYPQQQLSIFPNTTLRFGNLRRGMRLRMPSRKVLSVLDTAIGTLLCASVALMLALVFNQTRLELALPLICLAVIVAVAARFGVATGVLGSIISALLLAYFVYTPEDSFRIANADARANLSWLLLGGISLSFLFTPRRHTSPSKQHEEHQVGDD